VAKLVLMSAIIAMIAIPLVASRAKSSRRGLRWTVVAILLFNLFYVFAVRYIYPKLL
jgi:predicted membrane-bound dolichyl-phosphate-mannose-protein mannosyltransferase